MVGRRTFVAGGLLGLPLAGAASDADALAALRRGGVVVAFRHALAPGTFDPPGFRLGDCSTQRNLNDEGRAQARRLGEWFRRHGVQPAAVRTSPWCRCVETAELAFGRAEVWPALGSPAGSDAAQRDARVRTLRARIAEVAAGSGVEVWVTHQFVQSAVVGTGTASGDGLVLGRDAGGGVTVLARLSVA